MNYYKIITDTCRKYFAATSDGLTGIKLDYGADGNLIEAKYNPNLRELPSDVEESTFDEFIAARNEGEGLGGEAFVGVSPIHH